MRITAIEPTDLHIGSVLAPRQVIRVTLAARARVTGDIAVSVRGPAVTTPEPVVVPGLAEGAVQVAEVGVRIAEPVTEGARRRVTAIAEAQKGTAETEGEIVAAATGWTMWMVSHFHYDPVWWNTQAGFTETWYDLPAAEERRPPVVKTAFDLVRAHLDAARRDGDYKFVLAEVDYLKPYWDACPEDREDLRRLLNDERVEIVGGNYNEPNTNLTHPESTIRNAVYGIGYQRDVIGGNPESAWMLDAFGHDPSYPGLMADAGLTSSAWARGPFHMWGPNRHVGDNRRMQFPSEFEWISPSGRGLLTAYMANHYGAGWAMDERARTSEEAAEIAYGQFAELKPVAATRNVLLPVGADHVVPSRWCTEVHRDWAKRYVWPRFTVALPRDFFRAVRAELAEPRPKRPSPQTRDMNPVYTGKDVSYIDTKQAQRAAEVAVLDGERLATLAFLAGARYPDEELDRAWRLLVFGAHHDAITGSESDQVYVDLLGGWREAYELGDTVRTEALGDLAARIDTSGEGGAVVVANTLSWPRDGLVAVGAGDGGIADDEGRPVPALAEGDTLTFVAKDVPSLGHRVYRRTATAQATGWQDSPTGSCSARKTNTASVRIARNQTFEVAADPERGGALTSIRDLRTGRELIRDGGLGAEFVLQEEYPSHPVWGEGPWHLLPKGPGRRTGNDRGTVRAEQSPIGRRLVTETKLAGLTLNTEVILWDGVDRIDFVTRVHGSIGSDHLLRVAFDLDVPGARPVSEVGFAAIGRPFGFPDADAGPDLWTLDNPAHTWTALSATARIVLTGDDGSRVDHAIGVAEVIADAGPVRELMAALVAQGVTATSSDPAGPRYGALDVDSNLPDIRIVLGGPETNAFAAEVLAAADPAYRHALERFGRVFVPPRAPLGEVWRPGADLRGPRDLPVLIVTDPGGLSEDLGDARIEVRHPGGLPGTGDPVDDYSIALLNAGIPGTVAQAGGAVYLNLMRGCSTWPSGVWIDGPPRTAPDGSSLSCQHWTHTFRYSLAAGEGDWRAAGFVRAGQEFNHTLLAREAAAHPGGIPSRSSLMSVEPDNVVVSALKPAGNPLAAARPARSDSADGLTVRLYESAGRPATARIGLFTGIDRMHRADLLESRGAQPAETLEMTPAEVITINVAGGAPLNNGGLRGVAPRASTDISGGTVFTRYWLHNTGPAPLGNLPVAVHASRAGDRAVKISVAASGRSAAGRVELDVPDGWGVDAPVLDYELAAGEYAAWEIPVRSAGHGFLVAKIHDDLGRVLEDAVEFGGVDGTEPVDVSTGSESLELLVGGSAEIIVRVRNRTAGEIRGEARLISPIGTWGPAADVIIEPWTREFAVAAGAGADVAFSVRAPLTAHPGSWWALVKVAAYGHLHYTVPVAIKVV